MKVTRRDWMAVLMGAVPAAVIARWAGSVEITEHTRLVIFLLKGTDAQTAETKEAIDQALDAAGLSEKELPRIFLAGGADVRTIQ